MRTACVFILYQPDEGVKDSLLAFEHFPGAVYVIDNSEQPNTVSDLVRGMPFIDYFHDGVNGGIASRLNQACRQACSEGYEWLLTMDQDSFLSPSSWDRYCICISNYFEKGRVAMFGMGFGKGPVGEQDCSCSAQGELITSGSMINLRLFELIGPFEEALFIDYVDTEYCLRARIKGFAIIRFDHLMLEHAIGDIAIRRSLKDLRSSERSLHSPVRLYYMTRNYLYIVRQYKAAFPADLRKHKKDLRVRLKNNLLYGGRRWQTVRYIIKGYFDYLSGSMYKLN